MSGSCDLDRSSSLLRDNIVDQCPQNYTSILARGLGVKSIIADRTRSNMMHHDIQAHPFDRLLIIHAALLAPYRSLTTLLRHIGSSLT